MNAPDITEKITSWFDQNKRDLPWRHTSDPYRIWVSEVMLQQTQVSRVTEYYQQFINEFPTVQKLAQANRDQVLNCWEGMGFYARARNLHDAAQIVVDEHDGEIPRSVDGLKELPGIGEYTAAALSAFAFQNDAPVIDGNVKRVIARLNAIRNPVHRTDTERRIADFLEGCLEYTDRPDAFSEAVIELGALLCTPDSPRCDSCPIQEDCLTEQKQLFDEIPVTREQPDRPHHEIAAGVVRDDDKILIARRPEEKMLGGLWEFPGGKQEMDESIKDALKRELREELGIDVRVDDKIMTVPHTYSHLTINLHAYRCSIVSGEPKSRENQNWKWISSDELDDFPFPAANQPVIEELQSCNESKI